MELKIESIWSKTIEIPPRVALTSDAQTDVVVIGAGMAGILTAYFLQQEGKKVIVLEGDRIGSGQTKNTTAKITLSHNLIYDKLITSVGMEKALQYANANREAIKIYTNLVNEHQIDCHFEEYPAYLYSTAETGPLEDEVKAAQSLGIDAEFTTQTSLPFEVKGAAKFNGQAQFHPLKFIEAIAKTLTIYEHTPAIKVEDHKVITERGSILASDIVFATHFPFINVPGYYFLRMHQERSYAVALKNVSKMDGMYLGIDKDGLSFRNFDEYVFLGGYGHRTGENSAGDQYAQLAAKASALWQGSQVAASWAAQDCVTLDGVPYIGTYSANMPNWYVATGFAKWGMTSSMAAAQIIAGQIVKRDMPNAEVFNPQRFHMSSSAKNAMEEGLQAAKGLIIRNLKLPKVTIEELPPSHGGIVEYDGYKVGVYKTKEGEVFIVYPKCPHLGCQLEWNPADKSWDCPCHGSRFDYKGRLIDNPAQKDLEIE